MTFSRKKENFLPIIKLYEQSSVYTEQKSYNNMPLSRRREVKQRILDGIDEIKSSNLGLAFDFLHRLKHSCSVNFQRDNLFPVGLQSPYYSNKQLFVLEYEIKPTREDIRPEGEYLSVSREEALKVFEEKYGPDKNVYYHKMYGWFTSTAKDNGNVVEITVQ